MNRLTLFLVVVVAVIALSTAQTQTTGMNPQTLLWYAMMRGDWSKFMRYLFWSQAFGGNTSGGGAGGFNPLTLMLLRGIN